jgi:hypothetical protein
MTRPGQKHADAELRAAYAEHGSYRAAAKALGVAEPRLRLRLQRMFLADAAGPPALVPATGYRATKVTQRADGTIIAVQSKPAQEAEHHAAVPAAHVVRGVSTLFGADGTIAAQWVKTKHEDVQAWDAFTTAAREHAAEYAGVGGTTAAPTSNLMADLKAVYAIGDAHCGMLAWGAEAGKDFDLKIWRSQLQRALDLLMLQTPATESATILNVGDWYHVQSSDFRTPNGGNRLDGDSRLGKIARTGFDCMRWAIDRALQKHQTVSVRNVRGNHDPDMSVLFNMWLQSAYQDEPRVYIPDNFAYVDYERFGTNLLGYTHGDGCAISELPGVMSTHPDWSATTLHMWLTGHVHHKRQLKLQEYRNCVVESFSTMAPKDAWHAWKQYGSMQGIESLVFHRTHGLKGRTYVSIGEVEADAGGPR